VESLGREFVYGNYVDEVLLMCDRTGTTPVNYYYAHDQLYSPVALVNSSGTPQERYEYDAYGAARVYDGYFATRSAPSATIGNSYLFTGREVDYLDSANLALQYNRHRYYSQSLGRWTSEDPLGTDPAGRLVASMFNPFAQSLEGLNFYAYAKAQPSIRSDDSGLASNDADSIDDSKTCCKIRRTHAVNWSMLGVDMTESSTRATQETIDSGGKRPNQACKCKYMNQPEVEIYGYHKGECCFCKVYYYSYAGLIGIGDKTLSHKAVNVICDKAGKSWSADIFPRSFGLIALWPHSVSINITEAQGEDGNRGHFWGLTSCDTADLWKSRLTGETVTYQFPFYDCMDFAEDVATEIIHTAP
jgi:RHS repeat-associated protein